MNGNWAELIGLLVLLLNTFLTWLTQRQTTPGQQRDTIRRLVLEEFKGRQSLQPRERE